MDWNTVGHGALDVMGIFRDGADVLNTIWYACERKTKEALTSALCALPGLGMGVVAGISMAKTGITNILNELESGNLNGWDVVTFIGGIAITGLSGRNLAISGRGLAGMMDDAGKVAKAGKTGVEVGQGAGKSGSNTNWEAHNVVNYAKLKEQYRVSELANDVVDSIT